MLVLSLAVTLFASTASASFINGTMRLVGDMTVTDSSVTPATLANPRVISWAGGITTVTSASGDLSALAGTNLGISNLGDPPQVVDGAGFPLTGFINLGFDQLAINYIYPGIHPSTACGASATVPQNCSIIGSPFSFENTQAGSTASFTFRGATTDGLSTWVGLFTVQFLGKTYQEVLTDLALSPTHSVSNSYSGDLSVTQTPEPGTAATLGFSGLALIGLASWLRRR
jgi:hypothetical protein